MTIDQKVTEIESAVAAFVDGAQQSTRNGLPYWQFGDRTVWLERDRDELHVKYRLGAGLKVTVMDVPDGALSDVLTQDPEHVAARIAELLDDAIEPTADGPQGLS